MSNEIQAPAPRNGAILANYLSPRNGFMWLGIPMQVKEIAGTLAHCDAWGAGRDVSLFPLQGEPLAVGDFVMVHVGYAIQKVTPREARAARELHEEMLLAPE